MLTLKEAAAKVGGNAATLRRAAIQGRLKAQKRGRDWFVAPSDLEEFAKTYTPGRPGRKPQ